MRRPPSSLLAALALAALPLAGGCSKPAAPGGPPRQGARAYRVTAATVEAKPLTYSVEGVGSLEAYQVVTVPARVAGTLDRLDFDEGSAVTPETVLAVIDERRHQLEVERAKAAVREAEAAARQAQAGAASAAARTARVQATLDEARSNLTRWTALREKDAGFVTAEKIASVEAMAKSLAASLEEARAGETEEEARGREAAATVEARQAALALVEKDLEDTRVRSPIGGRVQSKHVAAGQYVKVGDPIATLVDTSRLRLRFAVTDSESVHLKSGQPVSFRVKAFPDRAFEAKLFHVNAAADPATRMVDCLAAVEAPDPGLKPGFFVQVAVEVAKAGASIVVPDGALLPTEKGFVAFVVEDGKAAQRLLTLGLHTREGGVEVLSGLAPGERIVVHGAQSLQPGVPLEVVTEGEKP
jgi:multidrug efflux system membrane fusion protein